MSFYTNIFENARHYFALRIASRLVGIFFAILFFFLFKADLFLYAFIFFSIVADIFIFKVFKLKESSYKSPHLFAADSEFSLQKYDAYTNTITNARIITLMIVTIGALVFEGGEFMRPLTHAFYFYMIAMVFLVQILAPRYNLPKDLFRGYPSKSTTTSNEPIMARGPGYLNGIYTGNPNHIT